VEATLSTPETNITWFIICNFTFVSSSILIMQKKKVECPWIFVKNTKQG